MEEVSSPIFIENSLRFWIKIGKDGKIGKFIFITKMDITSEIHSQSPNSSVSKSRISYRIIEGLIFQCQPYILAI